jgi:photosystem II stability/assembly factor-like uncharacterized protein
MSIIIARNMSGRAAVALFATVAVLLGGASVVAQTPPAGAAAPKMKGIWEPVNYGEDLRLVDVFFVTPEIGYVAGEAGTILKTTDAGASWTPLLGGDPQSQERAIKQLWFVTPTTGWATQVTSTQTNLFRTTDGDMWSRIGTMPEHYEDFAFATETEGVYVDSKKIFRTQDAGKTWNEVFHCATRADIGGLMRQVECNLWKLRFASTSVAYALGQTIGDVNAAIVVKSTDGGASWSVVHVLENESGTEGGLFFIDENIGYLSTHYAKAAFRTTDGGLTWTGMPATSIGRRIVFADPGVGWAMHFNMLSYTTDGGKRWSSRQLALPAMPNAFSLPRRDRAYVVGDHGMIYRYSVVPESTAVAGRAVVAPAMPTLDNAVLAQIEKLESRLDKIDAVVEAPGGGDWSSAAVDQQLAQMQSTIDSVASGVPAMGSKHRNLNLVMFGLQLLGDLTGQSSGLKEAFTSLRQSQDPAAASAALQNLHGTLDSMKTSVEAFQTARKPGG